MDDLAGREYSALRDTIRSRGGARPLALLAGVSVWAALLISTLIWLPVPLAAAVPLLVLLATFEVIRTLHTGVERIGRYLQVFYEELETDGPVTAPAWERTAMIFGPAVPGAAGHPLFLPVFVLADVLNFVAVIMPDPVVEELSIMAVPHLAFIAWLIYCDRGMRKQRTAELARYRALKDSRPG